MIVYRNVIFSGNVPIGIHNGVDGLINGEIRPIGWSDVTGWISEVTYLFIYLYIYLSTYIFPREVNQEVPTFPDKNYAIYLSINLSP